MANSIVTPLIFTKLTLMELGNALNVCANMSKEINSEYGKPKNAKPGDTVRVRKPYRFMVSTGLTYQPQAIVDQYVSATVSQVKGVHFEWDSVERTLSIREVDELYAKPAGLALASVINAMGAQYIAENTFNSVGTPGTVPNTVNTYLSAGDKIVRAGLPENEPLTCIVDRTMSSTYVAGVSTLYNPAGTIGQQYTLGEIAEKTLGYTFRRDETIFKRTVGTYAGTPLVNGANQTGLDGNNGTMTLNIDGWTSGTTTLNPGDRFTIGSQTDPVIGGVQSVHPQTKAPTGDLQQFVVLSKTLDATGVMATLRVAPSITITGPYQNVNISPVDNAIITMVGTSGKVTRQGILMHKSAYGFISVPLANPEPNGVEQVAEATDDQTGLSLSFIRAFDPVRRVHVNRFDTLFDFYPAYREMACIIES